VADESGVLVTHATPLVLVTGATGYVGGRLVGALERAGHRVRCLARKPERLSGRLGQGTQVVKGDVLDRASLDVALRGVEIAYYLVHSMDSAGPFEEVDRQAARVFAEAARNAGVRRIVYLGGLGDEGLALSEHLRSRQEVGRILRESGAIVVEFRASIVIGSGSLSYAMIQSLVHRLPIMVTPRWVEVKAQPIAVADLMDYLVAAVSLPLRESRVYEIGGADQVSYGDIMRRYARQRGKSLRMLPVPVLTPYVSSLWLGLVTPLYARVGRKLIESIVHATVVRDRSALADFAVRPMGVDEALRRALDAEDVASAPALCAAPSSPAREKRSFFPRGARLVDSRTITVASTPDAAFRAIERIGGTTGWYAWDVLWQLRGFLDRLVGGVGMRRGRRSPTELRTGDTVDCWRVESIVPGRRLVLRAEMKLPGRAWLTLEVCGARRTTIRQTATFEPSGTLARAYWYALLPLHELVFAGMLRGIARAAERPDENPDGNAQRRMGATAA